MQAARNTSYGNDNENENIRDNESGRYTLIKKSTVQHDGMAKSAHIIVQILHLISYNPEQMLLVHIYSISSTSSMLYPLEFNQIYFKALF